MVPELWTLTDQGWNPPNGHGPWAVLFLTRPVGLLTGTTCQVITRAGSKCSGTELAQPHDKCYGYDHNYYYFLAAEKRCRKRTEPRVSDQNCWLPAWFCPSCKATLPKREGERKRREGSVGKVERRADGWWSQRQPGEAGGGRGQARVGPERRLTRWSSAPPSRWPCSRPPGSAQCTAAS